MKFLIMNRKVLIFITAILFGLLLTSCGAGPVSESSSQEFGAENPDGNSTESNSSGLPWTTTEGDNGDGYTVSCNFSGDDTDGDLIRCSVYWQAQNTSNVPQEYYGYTYLEVDGAIYQTEDGYAELRTINPGSFAPKGPNSFWIPYGGYITALFKAEDPQGPRLLELPLNINVRYDG